jgi:CHASE2 domain-containing sensor protein
VAEIIYMANKGDAQQVELITERLDKRLVMLATLASAQKMGETPTMMAPPAPSEETVGAPDVHADSRAKLRMTVACNAAKHQAALRAVLEKVPERAKPALRRAIAVSVTGYQRALEALD